MSAAAPVGDDIAARLLHWSRDTGALPAGGWELGPLGASSAGYSNLTLMGELRGVGATAGRTLPFVLRLQPPGESIYPDHDVPRQHRVLRALHAAGLPVPRVLGAEDGDAALGAPFFIMERIEGQVPNENPLYHLEGWLHDLPVAARRAAWLEGIRAVARLARLDWRAAGLGFLAPGGASADGVTADDAREPLERQLDRYAAAIGWAERRAGREYPLLRAAEPWLRANRPVGAPVAFSWGDAKLGNCLYRDGRLVAMLDFEQATLTHPVDDLAWWLMLDDSLSRGYGVPRLEGLPSRAESVAAWEAESGLVARDLGYLEVFAAWRMAFVMARIASLFRARGWIPADSDMDVRNGGAALLAAHGARLGFAAADVPRAGG